MEKKIFDLEKEITIEVNFRFTCVAVHFSDLMRASERLFMGRIFGAIKRCNKSLNHIFAPIRDDRGDRYKSSKRSMRLISLSIVGSRDGFSIVILKPVLI